MFQHNRTELKTQGILLTSHYTEKKINFQSSFSTVPATGGADEVCKADVPRTAFYQVRKRGARRPALHDAAGLPGVCRGAGTAP